MSCHVLILDVVRLSVKGFFFSLHFDNICMERTWIKPKVHLIKRRGYDDVATGELKFCF